MMCLESRNLRTLGYDLLSTLLVLVVMHDSCKTAETLPYLEWVDVEGSLRGLV